MLLKELVDSDKPFVIYKKPESGRVFVRQQSDSELYTSTDLTEEGYYFAPFDTEKHPVVIFPKDKTTFTEILLSNIDASSDSENRILEPEIFAPEEDEYKEKVTKAVNLIAKGILKKIVLSRSIKVTAFGFDMFEAVRKLMLSYDRSYVYLWHHPKIGTWMGATPELLAGYQNGLLQTVSLAGTVTDINEKEEFARKDSLFRKEEMPDSWGGKEFNEQQIVTDYIVNSLKKFSADITVKQPETIRQGHLEHIKTRIATKVNNTDLSAVILQLHPTPAVCGLPADTAMRYIKQIEDYDRQFYTGFLGEKTVDSASLYVNLRCMKVFNNYLMLYVGGGIVSDSQPGKEWQEILLKSKVLLSALNYFDK